MTEQVKVKIILNTPIVFPQESTEKKKPLQRALITFGEMADKYTSLDKKYINAKTLEDMPVKGHVWKTAVKVLSYILTAGILPLLAMIAKGIYKDWASNHLPKDLPVQSNSITKEESASPISPAPTATTPLAPVTSPSENPSNETKHLYRSSSDLSSDLSVDDAKKVLGELPDVEESESSRNTATDKTKSVVEALSSDQKDLLVIAHLTALNTEEMPPESQIKHLFYIKEIADSGHKWENQKIGPLMKEILQPKLPSVTDLISKIGTGQYFYKAHRDEMKQPIPESFYDLSSFVEKKIKKILAQDKLIINRINKSLTSDQQLYLNSLTENHAIESSKEVTTAVTESGKKVHLYDVTKNGGRAVTKDKFEQGKANSYKDPEKWEKEQKREVRSGKEQRDSLKNAETIDFGTSDFGTA